MLTPRPRRRSDRSIAWQVQFQFYDSDRVGHRAAETFDDFEVAERWAVWVNTPASPRASVASLPRLSGNELEGVRNVMTGVDFEDFWMPEGSPDVFGRIVGLRRLESTD
ncbi:hypothetical protein [Nocardia abscessus]|uniref:hypothetical protein n=1 Tax=Nocardia abscessus TaxID=120957 RepID=UPI002456819F|nr:hypothetical protein [Nocardia abscessus]